MVGLSLKHSQTQKHTPLTTCIMVGMMLSSVTVIGGMLLSDPFHNIILDIFSALIVQTVLVFFILTIVHAARYLNRFITLRRQIKEKEQGRVHKRKRGFFKQFLLRVSLNTVTAALMVCSLLLSSFSAAFFGFSLLQGKNYQQTCLSACELYRSEAVSQIEKTLMYRLEEDAGWDALTAQDELTKELEESLFPLYHLSATQRAAPYLMVAPQYRKLEMAKTLTDIDPFTYLHFGKDTKHPYTEKTKKKLLNVRIAINDEFEPEYEERYVRYSGLFQEYRQILQSLQAGREDRLHYFQLDAMKELYQKAEDLQNEIICDEDVKALRHYHSVSRKDTKIIDFQSDSCISRLETHHLTYQNHDVQQGLFFGRMVLVYDAEDTFMELYDKLEELKIAVERLIAAAYGDDTVFSCQEMQSLLETAVLPTYDYKDTGEICRKLTQIRRQLSDHVNLLLADDYKRAVKGLHSLETLESIWKLRDELTQFSAEQITDGNGKIGLSWLDHLLNLCRMAGLMEAQEDIQFIMHYFVSDEPIERARLLLRNDLHTWNVMDISSQFEELHKALFGWFVGCFLFHMLLLGMGICLQWKEISKIK